MTVSFQLRKCCSNIFCRGTKPRAVIGSHQIVVDGLWCAHDTDILNVILCTVCRKLINGVHRIVSSDIDKTVDFIFAEYIDNLFKLPGLF